ncbi:unnamed protein product [Caretta caretta]
MQHELKTYSPEQACVVGKALGPLNRENALDWLANANSLPGISKEDLAILFRECMSGEEFGTLPIDFQVADMETNRQLFEGVLRFYFPHQNFIGRYYSKRPQPSERPEKYLSHKRLLYWLAGATTCDVPEFRESVLQGLSPVLKMALGPMDCMTTTLRELEDKLRKAHEIQREAFPASRAKRKPVIYKIHIIVARVTFGLQNLGGQGILGMDLISSMSLIVDLPNRKLVQDKNRSHEIIPSSHSVATVKALETLKLPQWEKDVADIALKHQEVFARNKLQCGKTSGEVRVDGPDLKPHSQYWYPVATEEGILSTIKALVEQGVLLPTESPCNSLICPVMKTDGETWHLMVDCRELNKVIPRLAPVVAKYNEMDILIVTGTKEENLEMLDAVLDQIKKTSFLVNPVKAQLVCSEVTYLGITIGEEGKRPDTQCVNLIWRTNDGLVFSPRLASWTLNLLNRNLEIVKTPQLAFVPYAPLTEGQDHEYPLPRQESDLPKSPFKLKNYQDAKDKGLKIWVVDGSCYHKDRSPCAGYAALQPESQRIFQGMVRLLSAQALRQWQCWLSCMEKIPKLTSVNVQIPAG